MLISWLTLLLRRGWLIFKFAISKEPDIIVFLFHPSPFRRNSIFTLTRQQGSSVSFFQANGTILSENLAKRDLSMDQVNTKARFSNRLEAEIINNFSRSNVKL